MSHALKQDFLPLAYTDWPIANSHLPWLVLLHGWGTDSSAWESCRSWQAHFRIRTIDLPGFGKSAESAWPGLEVLLAQLQDVLPERCTVMGWSMGGQLATLLAARCAEQVERLVTIASNPHFLASDDWPGMDAETANTFHALMEEKGIAGLKRFAMLVAHGDLRDRQVMEALRASSHTAPNEQALLASLATLESLDTRETLEQLPMPVLHILGEADQLVPVALAKALRREYPRHNIQVLPALAHAPFVSDAQAVFNVLHEHERKHSVAELFSQASQGYDAAAGIQQTVVGNLLDVMPPVKGRLLDMGCGTGLLSRALLQQPGLEVIGCDIAEGMLTVAREHGIHAVYGDAESLPFENAHFDAVVSSSVLQWCEAAKVLAEVKRVLKPGGVFVFSTFGEHTLCELKTAFLVLDGERHVNDFASLDDWQLWACDWQTPQFFRHSLQQRYDSVMALLHELKAIGANHRNAPRSRGLKGRSYWQALDAAYAARTADGGCTATWDVITGVLVKPA